MCVHHPKPQVISFHHYLSPCYPLLPFTASFPSGNHHSVVYKVLRVFLLSPFSFFTQSPYHLPSDNYQSVPVSMCLFLFCLSVYFVNQIPQIGEIIWYLSFYVCSDWFILQFHPCCCKG